MNQEEKKEMVEGTLKWCNTRRRERGLEPLDKLPKGVRNNPLSCPCGAASGVSVGTTHWRPNPRCGALDKRLPKDVSDFTLEFDSGRLPEYDLNPEV